MSTRTETTIFKHFDDCLMSGCPGHVMKAEHQTTSDFRIEAGVNLHLTSGQVFSIRNVLNKIADSYREQLKD